MPNSKGQTTLFVILGIAIVAAVFIVLFFMPQITKMTVSEEQARKIFAAEKGNVENYVKDCMTTNALKNINTLGRQGGWIFQSDEHFSFPTEYMPDVTVINYAYYYNKQIGAYINELPTIADMKDELAGALAMDTALMGCLSLKPFEKKFFVSTGYLDIDANNIALGETNGKIVIPFKYPVILSLGGVTTSMNLFSVTVPINLYKVRSITGAVVNNAAKGGSLSEVQKNVALAQALELRANPYAERIVIDAINYNWVPSDSDIYNTRNTFYTITYDAQGLEKPFIFNFLIGKE